MKPAQILIIFILAAILVFFGINLASTRSIYTVFDEAKTTGNSVHIVGEWVDRDNASYDQNQDLFVFALKDSMNFVEQVHYYDPKPINFEQAEKVVVVGGYKQDKFVADKIVMKCPSKYEPDDIAAGE